MGDLDQIFGTKDDDEDCENDEREIEGAHVVIHLEMMGNGLGRRADEDEPAVVNESAKEHI